jgi:hypothetical protein
MIKKAIINTITSNNHPRNRQPGILSMFILVYKIFMVRILPIAIDTGYTEGGFHI